MHILCTITMIFKKWSRPSFLFSSRPIAHKASIPIPRQSNEGIEHFKNLGWWYPYPYTYGHHSFMIYTSLALKNPIGISALKKNIALNFKSWFEYVKSTQKLHRGWCKNLIQKSTFMPQKETHNEKLCWKEKAVRGKDMPIWVNPFP